MENQSEHSLGERLVSVMAAVVFAVPTAFLLWVAANLEVASFGGFIESSWLWCTIAVFVLVSFFAPTVFVAVLGAVWGSMHRFAKWFH